MRVCLVLILLVVLAGRLIALDADPPQWLSWSMGLQTDEGFYTLDARHEAVFGTLAPGNFHDRLLSPVLSVLQQGVFRVFGVGTIPARMISVTFGLLTVIAFWYGLRKAFDDRVALWGALLLGLAPPVVLYNRMALQETPTVFWLVLSFALWVHGNHSEGRRSAVLLSLSGVCLALAVIFKAVAIIALPAFLVGWWIGPHPGLIGHPSPLGSGEGPITSWPSWLRAMPRSRELPGGTRAVVTGPSPLPRGEGWPMRPGWGLILALGLYLLLWYVPHHAELGRMGTYYRTHQFEPHSVRSVWLNIRRGFVDGERGVLPYLLRLLPIPFVLTLVGLGLRRKWTPPEVLLGIWLLCGLAFCLLSSYAPDRYYVLFYPALLGLAACGATRLPRHLQVAVVTLFLVTTGYWYGRAWAERDYARRDASARLAQTLPAGSVLTGEMAPALCLDTFFAAVPVQPGLSNDDRPLERLHVTHVLVTRAPNQRRWWQEKAPTVVQPSHWLMTLPLHDRHGDLVDVYMVKERGQ